MKPQFQATECRVVLKQLIDDSDFIPQLSLWRDPLLPSTLAFKDLRVLNQEWMITSDLRDPVGTEFLKSDLLFVVHGSRHSLKRLLVYHRTFNIFTRNSTYQKLKHSSQNESNREMTKPFRRYDVMLTYSSPGSAGQLAHLFGYRGNLSESKVLALEIEQVTVLSGFSPVDLPPSFQFPPGVWSVNPV